MPCFFLHAFLLKSNQSILHSIPCSPALTGTFLCFLKPSAFYLTVTHIHTLMREQLRATWGSVSLPKETLACRLEQAGIEPPTFQINKWTALPLALHQPQCDFINPLTSVGRNFGPLFFILLLWFIGFLNSLMVLTAWIGLRTLTGPLFQYYLLWLTCHGSPQLDSDRLIFHYNTWLSS